MRDHRRQIQVIRPRQHGEGGSGYVRRQLALGQKFHVERERFSAEAADSPDSIAKTLSQTGLFQSRNEGTPATVYLRSQVDSSQLNGNAPITSSGRTNYHALEGGNRRVFAELDFVAPRADARKDSSVCFLTGLCLFQERRDTPEKPASALTFYDQDSIFRLSNAVSLLFRDLKDSLVPGSCVAIHLPGEEYYLKAAECLANSVCRRSEYAARLDYIEQRVSHLETAFKIALLEAGYTAKVQVVRPLSEIRGYLSALARSSEPLSLSALIEILRGDRLWNAVLEVSPVESFKDLRYRSNCYAMLAPGRGHAVVAVDNPTERSILYRTRQIAAELRGGILPSSLGGVYCAPQVDLRGYAKTALFSLPSGDAAQWTSEQFSGVYRSE